MKPTLLATILFLTASPVSALNSCLVGVWVADPGSLAAEMEMQMTALMGGVVTADFGGGEISMEIDAAGRTVMLVNNLVIDMNTAATGPFSVSINGYSEARMFTDDGLTYRAQTTDYALVGSANLLGDRMDLPFNASSGMGGNSSGSYRCTETALLFDSSPDGTMPGSWHRIR